MAAKKPAVRKPIRKGALVYHATSSEYDFDMLEGPAFVSDTKSAVDFFLTWAGREGTPRIYTFKVVEAPSLFVLESERDIFNMNLYLGDKFGLYEQAEEGPHEMASALCSVSRPLGVDGWHVPNNYRPGSDTMLCEPERFLQLVSVERVTPKGRSAGASAGTVRGRLPRPRS